MFFVPQSGSNKILESLMISVCDYLDYRDFLKDHYNFFKASQRFFSFRYIALKTGLDPSFYVKVINKQKHIADSAVPALAAFCKLNKKETDYFKTLVCFNKEKRSEQSRIYFEKLISLRNPLTKILDKEKYDYFSSWYNVAVCEELKVIAFKGDFADLAARITPSITAAQAKRSVQLLEKLAIVNKRDDGIYHVTDRFVSTDGITRAMAIRNFQKETTGLAVSALERIPKEDRDISSLTVSTSRACLEAIRERIAEVRREIMEMVNNEPCAEEVYQLNFQVFPLTRNKEIAAP
jgi:uncharacterized protein (TIGR02147 family)